MNKYFCLLLSLVAMAAHAGGWAPAGHIDAPCCGSGSKNDLHFGAVIAADLSPGSNQIRALYVGAPGFAITSNGVVYPEAGRVYVYIPTSAGWEQLSYVDASEPQAYAHFGAALAMNSGILVVGEPDYDNQTHTGAGKITLFHDRNRNATTYMPPAFNGLDMIYGTVDNARLGASVAIHGDGLATGGGGNWIVAGAPSAGAGCAFLRYLGDDYSSIDKGSVCGATGGGVFGTSVAVLSLGPSNLFMAVGASLEGTTTGAVHVYDLSGGNLALLSNLAAPNAGQFDFFGSSVAIDNQRLYVGSTGRDKSGVGRTGSVSLFNFGGPNHLTFDTEVFPTTGANPGDLCGAAVYPNGGGTGFAMGCPGSDAQFSGEGFARVVSPFPFLGGTVWIDQVLQMGNLPHGADDLGRGVAMVGDRVFAGAPLTEDLLGTDNGGVQMFGPDALFADGFGG